jgi:hypothetical protein
VARQLARNGVKPRGVREERPQLCDHAFRLPLQTAVRDPQNPIPHHLKRRIARTVALERRPRPMQLMPIELDHQSLLVPDHIDFKTGNEGVHRRWSQPGITTKLEKPPF